MLGVVPDVDDEEVPIDQVETAVRDAPQSMIVEAFRTLRTNLQFTAPADRQRTIVVTSPKPDDGKTTIASNLAAALAQGGRPSPAGGRQLPPPRSPANLLRQRRKGPEQPAHRRGWSGLLRVQDATSPIWICSSPAPSPRTQPNGWPAPRSASSWTQPSPPMTRSSSTPRPCCSPRMPPSCRPTSTE